MQKYTGSKKGSQPAAKVIWTRLKRLSRKLSPTQQITNGPSGGIERADPLVPEGRGVAQLQKKVLNKKGQKSHRECQKTYIRSVTQINTAEQPELSLVLAHRNY